MKASKILVVVGAIGLAAILVSCEATSRSEPLIGISKIVTHPALDAVEQGIQDEFEAQGVKASFDLQSANGDITTTSTIATKFLADKVDLAIGIATPNAQALAQTMGNIPVLYTAVTDPVDAKLVESYEQGGATITGYSDMTPVKAQIEFLLSLKPGIKRIGHVYSSGEANAQVLADLAKKSAEELGLEFVGTTVANSSEVQSATRAIADRVDAIYVSTDNTVVSALPALVDVASSAGIPVMSADPSSAETVPVLAAWGFDYYQMGRATGRMAIQILQGAKTSDFPTQYMTDPKDVQLLINLDTAAALGITVPQSVIDSAAMVVQNGTLTKK